MLCASDIPGFISRVGKSVLYGLFLLLAQQAVFADGRVTLTWGASSDPNAVGYRIYYGGASGVYTNTITLGSATTATITGLSAGATYYFAATTVDASGIESPFSNEAIYVIPTSTGSGTGSTGGTTTVVPVPTVDPIANVVVYENSGAQTVSLTGIGAGSVTGNVNMNVWAYTSDGTIIPQPSVNYSSPNSTGTVTFTPAPNTLGTATIEVKVNNGVANFSQFFTVTVVPAPTLDPLPDVVVYQNSGTQTINLTGIGGGAAAGNATVSVWAYTSDATIVPQPSVNYSSPNSTGTLTFAPAANAVGTATVEVKVNNGSGNFSQFFTVTVVPAPVYDGNPTLDAITNLVIFENSAAQTINLTGINSGNQSGNDGVAVWAYTSDSTIVPQPTVNYSAPDNSGTLTFAPAADAVGTATIEVKVNNGTANFSRFFTVTVVPPPSYISPPTLDAIPNLTISQNAAAQTVSLTGISPGPGNTGASVNISATSSDTTIIATPTVSYANPNSSGTLTFVPVPNAVGTATVTVTVDNGGPANNLVTQTFTVTVNPVPVVTVAAPPPPQPTLNPLNNVIVYQNSGNQSVAFTGVSSGATSGNLTMTVWAYSSDTTIIPAPQVNYTNPNSSGTLTFAPAHNALGTATITVKANNGVANYVQTFNVTVLPSPSNPQANSIANVSMQEGTLSQTVSMSGISAGAGKFLRITATSSNPQLLPNPLVSYKYPNQTAMLTLRPVPGATGVANITVTLNNGARSNNISTQTFSVSVVAPQPPTLDPISNMTVAQDAGLQVLTLTGIGTGSAGSNPSLRISAASSDPLFFPTPEINYTSPSNTATLSFMPSKRFAGTVAVTVTVTDGNRYNNTVRQRFNITVTPTAQPNNQAVASRPRSATGINNTNITASLTAVGKLHGRFSFQVSGVIGAKYVVQATSDLTHWTSLQTNVAPFSFSEPMAAGGSLRLYRAIRLQ